MFLFFSYIPDIKTRLHQGYFDVQKPQEKKNYKSDIAAVRLCSELRAINHELIN